MVSREAAEVVLVSAPPMTNDSKGDEGVVFYRIVCNRVMFVGYSCMCTDMTDWTMANGLVMDSIPWPLCCEALA